MTIDQMSQALKSVGACFAVTTAKTILPGEYDGKASYHIHPDASNPVGKYIQRVYTQKQLIDWVRTAKAAARATDPEQVQGLWIQYEDRWQNR